MRKALVAGAMAIAAAGPAVAAPIITFNQGSFTLTPGAGTVFQNFESAPGGGAQYVPASANETVLGTARIFTNTVPGVAVDPDNNASNKFLAIENGSYSVLFGTPIQTLSFVLGSLDSYNSVTLNFASGGPLTLTGRQIIGDTVVGPFNSGTAGRVIYNFAGGPALTSVTFSSPGAAFEIDDLASAVPEPASWAMLIGGFALVGGTMRRPRTRVRQNAMG